jgi:hypothetical protein
MTNDYLMKHSERYKLHAAEHSGKGGVGIALALACLAWAVALMSEEQWWCIPLGLLGLMIMLWGMKTLDTGRRYYRLAEEEERWEELQRRSRVEEML